MTTPDRAVVEAINQRTGLAITRAGGTDTARRQPCPQCGAPTLIGLDDTFAAITTRADPRLLTRSDEVTALLNGRRTLHLRATGSGRLQLRTRDHRHITHNPADTTPVVAEHQCGQPLGTTPPPPPTPRTSDECPY